MPPLVRKAQGGPSDLNDFNQVIAATKGYIVGTMGNSMTKEVLGIVLRPAGAMGMALSTPWTSRDYPQPEGLGIDEKTFRRPNFLV